MNADNKACTLTADSQYVELAVEVFAMLAGLCALAICAAWQLRQPAQQG